jgi:hypothetical protein
MARVDKKAFIVADSNGSLKYVTFDGQTRLGETVYCTVDGQLRVLETMGRKGQMMRRKGDLQMG